MRWGMCVYLAHVEGAVGDDCDFAEELPALHRRQLLAPHHRRNTPGIDEVHGIAGVARTQHVLTRLEGHGRQLVRDCGCARCVLGGRG